MGLVGDLNAALEPEQVWQAALSGVGNVVGIDGVRIAELTMGSKLSYRVLAQSPDGPDLSAPLMRSPHDHPIIAHYAATRFSGWVSLNDLLPGRQWLEHPLYREVYRPAGVDAQISCAIQDSGATMLSLSLTRSSRDFSHHERENLRHLQWLMAITCRRVLQLQRERIATEALERAFSDSGLTLVLSPVDGRIIYASSILAAWSQSHPGVLDQLLQSVRTGRMSQPVQFGDTAWKAWTVSSRHGTVVTLSNGPTYRLTPRETQVLRALADGLTAHAIARQLGRRDATIRKHLEHIYLKLGVNDRLGAVNLARAEHLITEPPATTTR